MKIGKKKSWNFQKYYISFSRALNHILCTCVSLFSVTLSFHRLSNHLEFFTSKNLMLRNLVHIQYFNLPTKLTDTFAWLQTFFTPLCLSLADRWRMVTARLFDVSNASLMSTGTIGCDTSFDDWCPVLLTLRPFKCVQCRFDWIVNAVGTDLFV